MLADYCYSLIRETQTRKNKRQTMKCMFNNFFFFVRILYRDIAHYLILYIVIRNQHISFLLQAQFFNLIPCPLTLMVDRAIWLLYLGSTM